MSSVPQAIVPNAIVFETGVYTIIVSGLILVAALAWNSAFSQLFKHIFGGREEIIVQFIYAVMITFVVILVVFWLSQLLHQQATFKSVN